MTVGLLRCKTQQRCLIWTMHEKYLHRLHAMMHLDNRNSWYLDTVPLCRCDQRFSSHIGKEEKRMARSYSYTPVLR